MASASFLAHPIKKLLAERTERGAAIKIDEQLSNRLLNDLAALWPWDDRNARDQLPLLQYCLNRIWIQALDAGAGAPIVFTIADYERVGKLEGALNAHSDEVLRALGADCRPVAETVFRALTAGTSANDATRRPTRLGDVVAINNGDEERVRKVVAWAIGWFSRTAHRSPSRRLSPQAPRLSLRQASCFSRSATRPRTEIAGALDELRQAGKLGRDRDGRYHSFSPRAAAQRGEGA